MIPHVQQNQAYSHIKCSEFEQLRLAAQRWSADIKQLDPGKFFGEFTLLDLGDILVAKVQVNRKLEQKCLTPKGYRTFSLIADKKQTFTWRGHQINGNQLLVSPRSREIEAVCAPGFKLHTFAIKEKIFREYFEGQNSSDTHILGNKVEVLNLPESNMAALRRNISNLLAYGALNSNVIDNLTHKKGFHNKVMDDLFAWSIDPYSVSKKPAKRIRDISLERALDCIHRRCLEWPNIRELSAISGSSQRTLEYAFQERYGIGPKEYINKVRLNKVHNILRNSDPKKSKIRDIANENGFFHMSQFSADYKMLFLESPTTTLQSEWM